MTRDEALALCGNEGTQMTIFYTEEDKKAFRQILEEGNAANE